MSARRTRPAWVAGVPRPPWASVRGMMHGVVICGGSVWRLAGGVESGSSRAREGRWGPR
jgi:hypothetical protein